METADQEFTDRTADKGAGHQAEGGGSKGNGGGIRKAHAFQYRAEGTGGTVAADQGDGAVGQPHEGIFPEKAGKGNADEVLHDNEDAYQQGHFDDQKAPFSDKVHAGHVADTGEEKHHTPVLHHCVLGIGPDAFRV